MYFQRRGNKFGAKSTEYEGQVYHSKKEAGYAAELDLLKRAKEILDWGRQVKVSFNVCPDCAKLNDGNCKDHPKTKQFHLANYYVDFIVYYPDGIVEWVEVKGFETPEWKMKWRMLEAVYGNNESYKLTVIR